MEAQELTIEQQKAILQAWDNQPELRPSLLELIKMTYPDDPDADGRSVKGKIVKSFLASKGIRARAAQEYVPKQKIELSEEQQGYIRDNFGRMSAVEMSRILFSNNELSNLNHETKSVTEYVSSLNPALVAKSTPASNIGDKYEPPDTPLRAINKVNIYVYDKIDRFKISIKQKKDLESLMGYLHTYRFLHQIDNYKGIVDKELFESSFIRYTHDKSDLSQEEVDQYIVLSAEVVIGSHIQRRVEKLQRLLEGVVDDTEGKISMSLVESIDVSQKEYNLCVLRQQRLLESLKEKRSDKLKKQIKDNSSILNLVQLWKDEQSREKMIKLAELRKESLKNEISNLTSMEDVKSKIMGLSEDEVLNG